MLHILGSHYLSLQLQRKKKVNNEYETISIYCRTSEIKHQMKLHIRTHHDA